MAPPPFPPPTKQGGRIILVATITSKPGKGDEMQAALAAIRKRADSSEEPGTHKYHTTRQQDGDSDIFLNYEEYDIDQLSAHTDGEPFKALVAAGIVANLDIKYYREFDEDGKFHA